MKPIETIDEARGRIVDPEVAYDTMHDRTLHPMVRNRAALDLRGWIEAGGWPPRDRTKSRILDEILWVQIIATHDRSAA